VECLPAVWTSRGCCILEKKSCISLDRLQKNINTYQNRIWFLDTYPYACEIVQFVSRLYRHLSDTYWYCHRKNRIRCRVNQLRVKYRCIGLVTVCSRVPTIMKRYVSVCSVCVCILVNCIMYISESYLVPNIIKRYVFVLVRVYVIIMNIMSRIITHI